MTFLRNAFDNESNLTKDTTDLTRIVIKAGGGLADSGDLQWKRVAPHSNGTPGTPEQTPRTHFFQVVITLGNATLSDLEDVSAGQVLKATLHGQEFTYSVPTLVMGTVLGQRNLYTVAAGIAAEINHATTG